MYDEPLPLARNVRSTLFGDLLRLITQNADAALIVDYHGIVRFANSAAAHLFGRPPESLINQPFGRPLRVNRVSDIEVLRPDGAVVFAELRVEPIAWQGRPAFLARLHDITARKRAEQLLLESQRLLRTALDSLSARIAILDQHGVIVAVNQNWRAALTSDSPSEPRAGVGANYPAIWAAATIPEAHSITTGLRDVLQGRYGRFAAEYAVEHEGKPEWFTIHVSHCGNTSWGRAVVTLECVTERKRAEILDVARQRVLELVARQHSLGTVATELVSLTRERYCDAAYVALALEHADLFRIHDADLDTELVATLDALARTPMHTPANISCSDVEITAITAPQSASAPAVLYCWRRGLQLNPAALSGVLTLCRRTMARPDGDDLHFLDLVNQLAAIAVEQHERLQQLAVQAYYDPLTGLPNRALFEDRLRQALEAARRSRHKVAVLFIDLDRFKQINDTLGHSVGDMLLVQLARRFEGCVRASDTLARRGGDEFMLVLPEIADSSQVSQVAKRLHEMLRMPFLVKGQELFLSASIGASIFPDDGEDAETLQRNADVAMYRAKSTLRNSFQFFDPSTNRMALERLQLENQLRRALERDEFVLFYQPKVDRAGRLRGAEALIRWQHPRLGTIPPARFIPLAEELGLIVPIGEWCLQEVCRQLREWRQKGLLLVPIAVNISAIQFAQPSFPSMVAATIAGSNLDPRLVELELTESMLVGDLESLLHQLQELRALGVALALDDFGTGYSSLAYLQRLPLTTLKVDRTFVAQLDASSQNGNRGIVHAIVTLGRSLNLQLVAEGIETRLQHSFLLDAGCDLFQGFLFSPPLPAARFESLLSTRSLSA
ncbi:MAG: EAL domain-containing protein [Oscillochloridaceae bacterium]|nr:EAL domain-containing protein [Chloroflexaceae bacterium]MDW8390038.1 EAL domain-containing protein [Oscillochloridaceae bacterium]